MPVAEDVQQERINVIRIYWDALMKGDMKRFESLLADDVLVHYPGNHYLSGDYRGKTEVVGLYSKTSSASMDTSGCVSACRHSRKYSRGPDRGVWSLSRRAGIRTVCCPANC